MITHGCHRHFTRSYNIPGKDARRRATMKLSIKAVCHTCVASPTKKKSEKPIFRTNPRLEAPLPPFFFRRTYHISAITPASPLIEKSTTLRSSLWCSHCSVAKRQQFSCPLETATLSLKSENVVRGCWICFLSYCGQVFFLTRPSMSSTHSYHW